MLPRDPYIGSEAPSRGIVEDGEGVKFGNEYVFDSPSGPKSLLDLFAGQGQLVVYQFMDNGPDAYCPGCTHFTNNVADLAELANTGVSWATVSNDVVRNRRDRGET